MYAQGGLNDPGIARGTDFSESRSAADASARRVQVDIVEQVEEVATQIEAETLGDGKCLLDRIIGVKDPWTEYQIARRCTECTGRVERKSRGIEVLIDHILTRSSAGQRRIRYDIRAIQTYSA